MASIIQVTSVNYPESDGRPMGETDEHRKEMIRQLELLERFFAGQRVYRLDTGDRLLTAEHALRAEAEARQTEAEARQAAEAEVARLREELRRRTAT